MGNRTVLISGAGVAGPTLAFWLARAGFAPTVVEQARGLRSSGYPVDVRGAAVRVAERMGVLARLREAATAVPGLTFVTASGRRIGPLRVGRPDGDDLELSRSDLAATLYAAARDDAEFLFDESVTALHQDPGGVDVTFAGAPGRRFDLVVGADGLHSAVRALAFAPARDCLRPLGLAVAALPLHRPADDPDAVLLCNTPGRAVAVHPSGGNAAAAFLFRTGPLTVDQRDPLAHKQILLDVYGDGRWEPPDLLDRLRAADDLYFDLVSQVRLDSWTRGRVTLVGDAAAGVSLFGDGSSRAITGAHALAEALAATPGDLAGALRGYQNRHRAAVRAGRRGYLLGRALLVPRTSAGLGTRNLVARALPRAAPVSVGAGRPSVQ